MLAGSTQAEKPAALRLRASPASLKRHVVVVVVRVQSSRALS
jgi:hypothetical protein